MLVTLWCLTHRYQGLGGDAELYAVQAWARIHSNLFQDLFLRHTSQDTYTVFSPFYAWCIGLVGLRNAELVLTIVFKVWFFAASALLARRLFGRDVAVLAVAVLMITVGAYGAYGVFHYAEDWVTARSPAEALVITALVLHFRGLRRTALLIACAAMLVHPLMALPGVLVLLCLGSSLRIGTIGALAGVLASLGVALWAIRHPSGYFLAPMDADWLQVVRERSQFLFPELWSPADWAENARPFLSLTLSAIALHDARLRKLCASAMLVGAAGLAVALIASLVGPVSVLLQGQAWRWPWVTVFTGILFLAPTLLALWRDEHIGICATILVVAAWTLPAIGGSACLTAALLLALRRDRIGARPALYLRWGAVGLGAVVVAWQIRTQWVLWPRPTRTATEPLPMALMRQILGLQILCGMLVGLLHQWIGTRRSRSSLAVICGALFAMSAFSLPAVLHDGGRNGTAAEVAEFADWRGVIPPDGNVFVVPAHNSPAFAWFTLQRPSYLTVDQSSGVVFSRETALEVRRRSEVLLPMQEPDWKLLSNMRKARSASGAANPPARPLTGERLVALCKDPQLAFIVAREYVGFDPLRHTQPGAWKDWNLYDCRRARSE
jgi:hypothetical protein